MSLDKRRQAICSCVARILREERLQQKMTLSALAEQAGLSYQMISYVEREMRNPTLDTLLRITGVLGVELAQVVARASETANRKAPK